MEITNANIDYYEDLAISETVTDAKLESSPFSEDTTEEEGQLVLEKSEYDDVDEDAPEVYYFTVVEDDEDIFYNYEYFDSISE